jgi:S-adenosylmethionine:tRNA ribosyltransferase-isomerase
MDLSLFDFHLPEHLIAQHPPTRRQDSRLLIYDRKTKQIKDTYFSDIVSYLNPTDVLIRNNTKVIPARLYGEKVDTKAHVELILLDDLSKGVYRCLVGNAKVVKVGTSLRFGDGRLTATCIAIEDEGLRLIQFHFQGVFLEVLESLGEIPLPPYIKEHLTDKDRYQTVYAKVPGSAAAPTAGFHFTMELFQILQQRGIAIEDITLQIGLGTFKPVKVDRTEDHVMHVERYTMTMSLSDLIRINKKTDGSLQSGQLHAEHSKRIANIMTNLKVNRVKRICLLHLGIRFERLTHSLQIFIFLNQRLSCSFPHS